MVSSSLFLHHPFATLARFLLLCHGFEQKFHRKLQFRATLFSLYAKFCSILLLQQVIASLVVNSVRHYSVWCATNNTVRPLSLYFFSPRKTRSHFINNFRTLIVFNLFYRCSFVIPKLFSFDYFSLSSFTLKVWFFVFFSQMCQFPQVLTKAIPFFSFCRWTYKQDLSALYPFYFHPFSCVYFTLSCETRQQLLHFCPTRP